MSLPLFLVSPGVLSTTSPGGDVVLDGPEGRHAATVRRIGVGERVAVSDGRGRRAVAEVVGSRGAALVLRVTEVVEDPEPSPRFVLVQALAKADRDEQAIEAATELGVDEIVPWQAGRSVVVWRGERAARSLRKWESVVAAATKQARRSRLPPVSPLVTTGDLVRRLSSASLALVLHEEAPTQLAGLALPKGGDVVVVVGPEGGIGPEELEALTTAGAVAARLGANVLRSSSAGPAALAVLSAARRWR
jgi:16S rRNA (uracil1498-N3)-methyltransferase